MLLNHAGRCHWWLLSVQMNWFDCQRLNDNGILIQRLLLNIKRMHSFGMEFRCIRLVHEKYELMAHLSSKWAQSIKFDLCIIAIQCSELIKCHANSSGSGFFGEILYEEFHWKQRLLQIELKNIFLSFLLSFWFIDHLHSFALSRKLKDILILRNSRSGWKTA